MVFKNSKVRPVIDNDKKKCIISSNSNNSSEFHEIANLVRQLRYNSSKPGNNNHDDGKELRKIHLSYSKLLGSSNNSCFESTSTTTTTTECYKVKNNRQRKKRCYHDLQYHIGSLSVAMRMHHNNIETIKIESEFVNALENYNTCTNNNTNNSSSRTSTPSSVSLATVLFQSIGRIPNLKHLCIYGRCKDRNLVVPWLTTTLQLTSNLTSLELCNIKLCGKTKEEFLQLCDTILVLSCTTLTKLDFSLLQWDISDCDDTSLSSCFFGLDDFVANSIAKLPSNSSLIDVRITGSKLLSYKENNNNIESNTNTEASSSTMIHHHHSTRTETDTIIPQISFKTIQAICQLPMLNRLALINLDLDRATLFGSNDKNDNNDKESLSTSVLPTFRNLRHLNLSCNRLLDEGFAMLLNTLLLHNSNSNNNLEELVVGSNNLSYESAIMISDALKDNDLFPSLKLLNLANNSIGNMGAIILGQSMLCHNHTVQTLQISNCDFGDDGITSISDALRINQTLCALNIEFNNITFHGYETLFKAVENNLVLKRIDFKTSIKTAKVKNIYYHPGTDTFTTTTTTIDEKLKSAVTNNAATGIGEDGRGQKVHTTTAAATATTNNTISQRSKIAQFLLQKIKQKRRR